MTTPQDGGGAPPSAQRYSRQLLFRPIGASGQARLREARVAIAGMGALGTVSAAQLARAGVGRIRCIDRDIVEASNLQRQILYDEADAAAYLPKAEAAARKLRQANSEIAVEPAIADLTAQNAESLLADVDLILDGTDNFQARHLINDVSVKRGIPWAYGGAVSSYGASGLFRPGATPCLVCLFGTDSGEAHDTCDTAGVIAPAVAIIASLQAGEALKWLTGNEDALNRGLTYIDVWDNTFRTVAFGAPRADCPCCGARRFASLDARTDALAVSLCGRRTVQVRPPAERALALDEMARRLSRVGAVVQNGQLLRLDLGAEQISLFKDGRALIHGVDDTARARTLYARYIGM